MPSQLSLQVEARWLAAVEPAKRQRLRRLASAADRQASLLGLALLSTAVAASGCAAVDVPRRLRFPFAGKPWLPGGPDFSIAHARGLVACAVASSAEERIGLDLEPIDAVRAEQLRLVLDARERAWLQQGTHAATALWVAKEAVLKCAGLGADGAAAVRLDGLEASLAGSAYRLHRVTPLNGFEVCVAVSCADSSTGLGVRLCRHEADQLLSVVPTPYTADDSPSAPTQ